MKIAPIARIEYHGISVRPVPTLSVAALEGVGCVGVGVGPGVGGAGFCEYFSARYVIWRNTSSSDLEVKK